MPRAESKKINNKINAIPISFLHACSPIYKPQKACKDLLKTRFSNENTP